MIINCYATLFHRIQVMVLFLFICFFSSASVYPQTGSISGVKFNDLNGDGIRDQNEPLLPNWTIRLEPSDSTKPMQTQVTNAQGQYQFNDLPDGSYTINELMQPGWRQTFPTPGSYLATISGGNNVPDLDFGNMGLVSIRGYKFNDLNGNGVHDTVGGPFEPWLSGWTIQITGPVTRTTVTSAGGYFIFQNVPAGIYTISEVQQSGWIQTLPAPPGTYIYDLQPGQIVSLMFGNIGSSSIRGKVFDDLNATCAPGSGLQNRIVRLDPGPYYALADELGEYAFPSLGSGTYTLTLNPRNYWEQTCPASPSFHTVNLGISESATGVNFGSHLTSIIRDLATQIAVFYPFPLQTPCCGQGMSYCLFYYNNGSVPISNAKLRFVLSGTQQYVSEHSNPPIAPASVTGSVLVWDFSDPIPPDVYGTIVINVSVNCQQGSLPTLVTNAKIMSTEGDDYPDNNNQHHSVQVACSYDPNDKQVAPQGCGTQGYITANDSLTYTIHFQNVGNAPAHRVIVLDTLDPHLDIAGVEILGCSHPYVFEINERELKWTFPDIELPPMTDDEAGSNGFIHFTVEQSPGNADETVIQNHGAIYFDLNDPVITNTTTNTITSTPLPVSDFLASAETVEVGQSISFTYTGGTVGASYLWNFGSGSVPETSITQNPDGIIYATAGTKVVYLLTSLGDCTIEPAVRTITVIDTTKNRCMVAIQRKWNMVSLPLSVSNDTVHVIFPQNISGVYTFTPLGYVSSETLSRERGYWVKFPSDTTVTFTGSSVLCDTFPVAAGWNMIGSLSVPVDVTSIVSEIPGIVASEFFGYDNRYVVTSTIEPGKGYWVKVNQPGELILSSSVTGQSSQRTLRIAATAEMPPPPPGETVSSGAILPDQFFLEQNYPNPFNPITVIGYALPVRSSVSLKVYTMLGQEIATLVNGMQDAGYKSVEFNASRLPSGIYMYKLQAGNYVNVKKLILIQ